MLTNLSFVPLKKQIDEIRNKSEQVRIGVLALQGAFSEHCLALYKAGAVPVEVRTAEDLRDVHGLCFPGGESTVMAKLLVQNGLTDRLAELIQNGMPVLATCAGLILLSREIIGYEDQPRLNCLDLSVCRNAFGRQKESFAEETEVICPKLSMHEEDRHCLFPAVFIRAPQVAEAGNAVKVLARKGERILAVQQENITALSFHPELTENLLFHNWLYEKAKQYKKSGKC